MIVNICTTCGIEFQCSGDEGKAGALICTHERCAGCQHEHTFSLGIAFPNPVQISNGITASYTDAPPIPQQHWHRDDDPEGLNKDQADPFTGDLYETGAEKSYQQRRTNES